MDRTTIMIDEQLKARATKCAYEQGISFAELVRLSLEAKLKSLEQGMRDPLFSDTDFCEKEVPRDVSLAHDTYLYE